jgi:hypothetical protein
MRRRDVGRGDRRQRRLLHPLLLEREIVIADLDQIAVLDGGVAAVGTVDVIMRACGDVNVRERALVVVVLVRTMYVPVVEIIDVPVVLHGGMATVRRMGVLVGVMGRAGGGHRSLVVVESGTRIITSKYRDYQMSQAGSPACATASLTMWAT